MKSKKRLSLRAVLSLLLASVLLLNLVLMVVLSGTLLPNYYESRMQKQLKTAYGLLSADTDMNLSTFTTIENMGISLAIVSVEDEMLLYSSQPMNRDMLQTAIGVIARTQQKLKTAGGSYVISYGDNLQLTDTGAMVSYGKSCYLNCILGNRYIELYVLVEPVSDMVQASLEFNLFLMAMTSLLLLFLVQLLSRQVTKPLTQITAVADQIAQLDFSRQCRQSSVSEVSVLSASINQMSDQLQTYTRQLQQANDQLHKDIAQKERDEASRKRLIADISHDLKTPIALISGYAAGIRTGMAKDPNTVQEYTAVISDEADRMDGIVKKLLTLSRLESGTAEPEVFDLSELLTALLSSFSIELEKAGIVPEVSCPGGLYADTSYDAVEQALTNYLQNAIYHMGQGKVLRVSLFRREDMLRVEVFNSAEPFSEEARASIWEPFTRLEPSRKREHGESGLGLSIVKSAMEALSLPYGVQNAEGGVLFYLEVPEAAAGDREPE